MANYERYSEKAIRNKHSADMDDLERDFVAILTSREADKFMARFRDEPRFLEAIVQEMAKRVIANMDREEGGGE